MEDGEIILYLVITHLISVQRTWLNVLGYSSCVPLRINDYYFTLFITPMLLVSGVFFPADQLPRVVHTIAAWLPLSHAVQLARPLLLGQIPENALLHVSALLAIALAAFYIATTLTRRRLLK